MPNTTILEVNVLLKVTLELRYGREDEELMGLQFCNEMVVIRQEQSWAIGTIFSFATTN